MPNNELITELITYSILKKLESLNALIEKSDLNCMYSQALLYLTCY